MSGNAEPIIYTADRAPDLRSTNPVSQAWQCNLNASARRLGKNPEDFGGLRAWIIYAPWAHPAWNSYLLALIHLRPVAVAPEPAILLPGATHEVMLSTIDPRRRIPLNAPAPMLTPANFHGQFIRSSDAEAIAYIDETAQMVVDGQLSPDTDYLQWWIRRFSASNINGDPSKAGQTQVAVGDITVTIPPVPVPKAPGKVH